MTPLSPKANCQIWVLGPCGHHRVLRAAILDPDKIGADGWDEFNSILRIGGAKDLAAAIGARDALFIVAPETFLPIPPENA